MTRAGIIIGRLEPGDDAARRGAAGSRANASAAMRADDDGASADRHGHDQAVLQRRPEVSVARSSLRYQSRVKPVSGRLVSAERLKLKRTTSRSGVIMNSRRQPRSPARADPLCAGRSWPPQARAPSAGAGDGQHHQAASRPAPTNDMALPMRPVEAERELVLDEGSHHRRPAAHEARRHIVADRDQEAQHEGRR